MIRKTWATLFIFFLFFCQFFDSQSQNFSKNCIFQWSTPFNYQQDDEQGLKFLFFEGAISSPDYETLPCYYTTWPSSTQYDAFEVTLSNEQYVRMTADEVTMIPAGFAETTPKVHAAMMTERKKHEVGCWILPFRKSSSGYEKLVSATVSVRGISAKAVIPPKSYVANSVLQSGTWYRISVQKDGIYKVTWEDLSSLGVPVSGLRHANISVFGRGGGMLPEANADFRYDDLPELPIEMHAGSDDSFDAGDYFLFYATGPHKWQYDTQQQLFTHQFNIYDNKAYYFICVDAGIGEKKRIASSETNESPTQTVNTYTAYGFYEVDSRNLSGGGRNWYGTRFDGATSESYMLTLPSSVNQAGRLTVAVAATSIRYSTFSVAVNGQSIGSVGVPALAGADLAEVTIRDLTLPARGGSVTVDLSYNKPTTSSVGYLDYLEWQIPCALRMESRQTPFCAPQSVAPSAVSRFELSNATQNVKIWDVTDIPFVHAMATTLSGSTMHFVDESEQLHHYVAFTPDVAYSVQTEGKVANQNLHGTSLVDMVIVSHPDFISQAERLAAFHRENDGMSVKIVTPQQVYNEFSGGSQDVTAIRDYMKMIYDKTEGAQPGYLLLFGRPSYDYRGIEGSCKLYVPNYQNLTIDNDNSLRANDDYFSLLDENEGGNCMGALDIAVGRFPVSSSEQARIAVDKTIRYATTSILGEGSQSCNYGDWKNVATYVADDEDGVTHVGTADAVAQIAGASNPNINLDKIYLDAYRQVSYSSSARYPEVTTAINNRMNRGCLLFTYVGHGGKYGWSAERIIELTDIMGWRNRYNQPWMVTLTCEFGWYDRGLVSPAELVFLNENGGASAMITTSRRAFTVSNDVYARHLNEVVFCKANNQPYRVGDLNKLTKNSCGGTYSQLNMIYVMGDPALQLRLPTLKVVTDSVNGIAVTDFSDTLRALSRVHVDGHIEDEFGNLMPGFSGAVYPSIYDKKQINHTLQNDPDSDYFEFEVQKSLLFKGNATVRNGRFSFDFILPKDINYAYGNGKMSYYANSSDADAAGAFSEVVIGGMSENAIVDTKGPDIELYMNDENFVNGGEVNPSPTLLVRLRDDYGINTTGNGIGHDLVAILDDGEQWVMNNYYEAERDSFNCGSIRYPLENLSVGTHTLKVRAWDILNNVSESELEFRVVSDQGLVLDHVLNYPNPFTTHTSFYFEHNQPGATLDILVTIYTISGKVVRTLESTQSLQGYRSDPIEWDGLDDFGDKIGKGTYLYRLRVRTQDGQQAEKFEKIVIL